MNLGEIIRRVQRQFGDESGAQITTTDITDWANDAQLDIVRKTECLQFHYQTDAIADDGSYTLPIEFIKLRRVSFDGVKLDRVALEELDILEKDREANPRKGTPNRYYIWGQQLWIYPIPEKAGTDNLRIYYVKRPIQLSGNDSIPEIPVHMHEDIVRYCLARAKELDQEDEKSEALQAEYENRVSLSRDESQNPENDVYPAIAALPGDMGYSDYPVGSWW